MSNLNNFSFYAIYFDYPSKLIQHKSKKSRIAKERKGESKRGISVEPLAFSSLSETRRSNPRIPTSPRSKNSDFLLPSIEAGSLLSDFLLLSISTGNAFLPRRGATKIGIAAIKRRRKGKKNNNNREGDL